MRLYTFFTLCSIFIFNPTFSQVDHWESVILEGDSWNYVVPVAQPSANWTIVDFDDTAWSQAPSGIGYGDNDDATIIPNGSISLYMRKEFTIVTVSEVNSVLLDMDFDDGFVAYINGTEIARVLVSGEPPAFDQPADGLHEALQYTGADPDRFEIDRAVLMEGKNILAIEIHNESSTSSDLSAIPTLSLGISSSNNNYRTVPEWFDIPTEEQRIAFVSSNLPIVVITTDGGQEIPNEPKIGAVMKIIENGERQQNKLSDTSNVELLNFSGNIEIEYRGSTSGCCWHKKQYAFTTYDENKEKDNVSLLSLPSENDWILNGFAFDPSFMRDYVAYQLSLRIGQYASRGKYCEVFLNGDYLGLYVLQEKLKADKNRIDINKIEESDIEGELVTGGYITKSDKTEGADIAAWYMSNFLGGQTAFVHEHPKPSTVSTEQDAYIKSVFYALDDASRTHNTSLIEGFSSIIDMPSFIDFMLINELMANVDAYQFSTYFHKDRNGKLRAGPIWDFNLSMGNDLFLWGLDRSHTNVWQFDNGDNVGAKFWKQLFGDRVFNCYLSKRWRELTQEGQPFHKDQITAFIDEIVTEIDTAVARDNVRWGTDVIYEDHVAAMKKWIINRIDWMNSQLGDGLGCEGEEVPNLVITKINYHPMVEDSLVDESDLEFLEITNISNEDVNLTGIYFGGTGLVYQFPAYSALEAGGSLYLANDAEAFEKVYEFAPFDEYSRSLSNGGQKLTLSNGYGAVIDEVAFGDKDPWPQEADGEGFYLGVINPANDNNDPGNWKAIPMKEVLHISTQKPVLNIFPNPTSEVIHIVSMRTIRSIQVYDEQGRILDEIYPESSKLKIDCTTWRKGLRFLHINTDNQQYVSKVVVE